VLNFKLHIFLQFLLEGRSSTLNFLQNIKLL